MRKQQNESINRNHFDVTIIGGGISGASLYYELCSQGYKVLLIDKGDFGCGTSQASGMMIWGGLLYLKNLDFKTVAKLCSARDQMLVDFPHIVAPCNFRYLPCSKGGRHRFFVYAALILYWLMGSRNRLFPCSEKEFSELELIKKEKFKDSLLYEEAFLRLSDFRFVLSWLTPWNSDRTQALNYCKIENATFLNNKWHIDFEDKLTNRQLSCSSQFIVNAAGIWTDEVNLKLGIESPYKHIFSKGVYLNLPRPDRHLVPLIFEMGQQGDSQSYVPWGQVSMWGPTETTINDFRSGFIPVEDDINFLLDMANSNLKRQYKINDIISLRCGVRPLAVKNGFNKEVYSLNLSRKHLIHKNDRMNFLALYGGKLTSCRLLAKEVVNLIESEIQATKNTPIAHKYKTSYTFPGLEKSMPSPRWCFDFESCYTLEDYLRRRTNIAQWVPNGGFGRNWENKSYLLEISKTFHHAKGEQIFNIYYNKVKNNVLNRL